MGRIVSRNGLTALGLSLLWAWTTRDVVYAFDMSRSDNLVAYWGQNAWGGGPQARLASFCGSNSPIDTFPISFLNVFFGPGGVPEINLADTCSASGNPTFAGTSLAMCTSLAQDIRTCQAAGKIVTLSLGGAESRVGFSNDAQARSFADTVFDTFLGGNGGRRPFGNAVLDGIDLDIEAGTPTGYAAFVNQVRARSDAVGRKVYITAAPQCPFPDAHLGAVLNAARFDAVYVQFYNNYCGVQAYDSGAFNFATWDNWARNTSPNKAVKVYIGVPAARSAAGTGYVSSTKLAQIVRDVRSRYRSFGGVMMWDASVAVGNGRFDLAIKNVLTNGAPPPAPAPPETTTRTRQGPTTTTRTTSPRPDPTTSSTRTRTRTRTRTSDAPTATSTNTAPMSCDGVALWVGDLAYNGKSQVIVDNQLWTAKWWTMGDTPGTGASVWQTNGPCSGASDKSKVIPAFYPAPSGAILEVNGGGVVDLSL